MYIACHHYFVLIFKGSAPPCGVQSWGYGGKSGYSTVFPAGVMVGTVDDMSDSNDGLSYLLKIKLATDFGKLGNVRVISRSGQGEQRELENMSTK